MRHTEITITFGAPDTPEPTRWSMARLILASVFALASLAVLCTPPAKAEYVGRWFLSLGITLGSTLALIAFDAWRARRRRAGHRWF
jgi:hypothetical protein